MYNEIHTIGYHTCRKDTESNLKENAPFLSVMRVYDDIEIHPYFGEGYYMWDNNLPAACEWGDIHYGGTYSVMSYELELRSDNGFLDLVGNMQDIKDFLKLYEKLVKRLGVRLKMGAAIDMLRMLHGVDENIFPYRIIRAVDCNSRMPNRVLLSGQASNRKSYINLNPKYYICYFEKSDVPVQKGIKVI